MILIACPAGMCGILAIELLAHAVVLLSYLTPWLGGQSIACGRPNWGIIGVSIFSVDLNRCLVGLFVSMASWSTYRLPGGGCASTLLARHKHIHVGFTAASMPPRAKSVLTPGLSSLRLGCIGSFWGICYLKEELFGFSFSSLI
ncbi:hypothetical protein L1D40_04585 [Shewanella insulae]|uniref:hypothetical protein n=1 Tax=Shewanella insulae TaxID=2681496 RepID=UPI001EFD1F20|nr:hypothetical protein [Shewanella insulae]MCG9754506.1 hypothetical protein [Shewanella insulae]